MGTAVETRSYERQDSVVFCKTNEEFGGLSNMAPGFPLRVNGIDILTSEALYQACRFPHLPDVQRLIITQKSPMTAKMKSKPYRSQSRGDWDVVRVRIMRWCLRVKLALNWTGVPGPTLGHRCTARLSSESRKDDFWGAKVRSDGVPGWRKRPWSSVSWNCERSFAALPARRSVVCNHLPSRDFLLLRRADSYELKPHMHARARRIRSRQWLRTAPRCMPTIAQGPPLLSSQRWVLSGIATRCALRIRKPQTGRRPRHTRGASSRWTCRSRRSRRTRGGRSRSGTGTSRRCTSGGPGGRWRRAELCSCAALWPDPADPLCPERFRKEAAEAMRAWRDRRGGKARDWAKPGDVSRGATRVHRGVRELGQLNRQELPRDRAASHPGGA